MTSKKNRKCCYPPISASRFGRYGVPPIRNNIPLIMLNDAVTKAAERYNLLPYGYRLEEVVWKLRHFSRK